MRNGGNDIVQRFAENMVKTDFNDISSDVMEITKIFILDTFGTALAGSSAPGSKGVVEMLKAQGGSKDAHIWTYGYEVPLESAAFINSVMAHARDFDDTHDRAIVHANTSVLPAAFSLAEQRNKSGRELLTAVALGVDFSCRIGLAAPSLSGWIHSSTLAYFASTLASCKVAGFDADKTINALGIVYSQVAGNTQCLVEGSLTKRMQPAFGAKGGVFACLLAEAGITGPKKILEGKYGFFNLYQGGNYNRDTLIKDIGRHLEGKNLSMKPYPCCRATHAALDITLKIVNEQDIDPENIESIIFNVTPLIYDLVGKPFKIGTNPQVDAQFSIPYTTATAITRKDISLKDFENSVIINSPALELTKRIQVIADSDGVDPKALVPVTINMKMKNGKVISRQANAIKGSPEDPMSMQECFEKFKKCNEYSEKPLKEKKLNDLIELIMNMENLKNVSKLGALLSHKEAG